ncbi:MAG TPA: GNAT family N-acetyltransferase [Candidatus Acidoferrum sp.]|nr:GNAT family N-acetyltransferase [Candidatus Acidoferrum sp.]
MTNNGFKIESVSEWDQLLPLKQQWNDLALRQELGPDQQFDWLSTVWEVNRRDRQLLVLLVRDAGELVAIAPFVKEIEKKKGLAVRTLRPLSWFHALHGAPFILGSNRGPLFRLIFDHIANEHSNWHIWFSVYRRGEDQETYFKEAQAERGLSFESNAGVSSPYLRIAETWDEKVKSLQPRLRTALRSREKRLNEKGRMELRFFGPKDWQDGLECIQEIESDSWKISAGSAITKQDFQWQFYSRYAPIAASNDTLCLSVLFLDNEPLAYDYALFERGIYYLLKTSYKQKWKEHYPGFVLRKLLTEWVYTKNGKEIDYLGKDEDWKMKWTTTVREHTISYTYNRNLGALYLRGLHRLGTLLRRAR